MDASPTLACPDCLAGRMARQQVWSDDLVVNVLIALVPFIVIGAVSIWTQRF
jgi:hypothetical protein